MGAPNQGDSRVSSQPLFHPRPSGRDESGPYRHGFPYLIVKIHQGEPNWDPYAHKGSSLSYE